MALYQGTTFVGPLSDRNHEGFSTAFYGTAEAVPFV
jgi:hypothetical protein